MMIGSLRSGWGSSKVRVERYKKIDLSDGV